MLKNSKYFLKNAIAILFIVMFVPLIVSPVVVSLKETNDILVAGKSELKKAFTSLQKTDLVDAKESFSAANKNFNLGIRKLNTFQISIASYLPFIGRQINAIKNLADSANEISYTGLDMTKALENFYEDGKLSLSLSDGYIDIDKFKKIKPFLKSAKKHLLIAESTERKIPSKFILKSIKSTDTKFVQQLNQLKKTVSTIYQLTNFLPSFFGEKGQRTYFLAIQNNAELRGTGGLIGNYGILKIKKGKISLEDFNEIHVLNKKILKPVRAPRDFRRRYGVFNADRFWLNVNMSPDFPTVSRVISDLFYNVKKIKLDGVIAIDPVGLKYILEVIGPVKVESRSLWIDSSNVVDWTLNKAYIKFPVREDRKEFLSEVSEAVWKKLINSNIKNPFKLIKNIGKALREKHMIIFSSFPLEERIVRNLNFSGGIDYGSDDYLMLVMQNLGENKIDYYLRQKINYETVVNEKGEAQSEVKIDLINTAPKSGLPTYIGGKSVDKSGWNVGLLNLYTPENSRLIDYEIDGMKQNSKYEFSKEMGKSVFSIDIQIPPQSKKRVVVRFKNNRFVNLKKGRISSYLQVQPTVNPAQINYEIVLPRKMSIKGYETVNSKEGMNRIKNIFIYKGSLETDKAIYINYR